MVSKKVRMLPAYLSPVWHLLVNCIYITCTVDATNMYVIFRLFSNGGNFCPAEVTDYSKRLEKVCQKIDATEQSILVEVKAIEPKRAEQTLKIVQDVENR